MDRTYPPLDITLLAILSDLYTLRRSLLCASSYLGPEIFLNTLLPDTYDLYSLRDHDSHPCRITGKIVVWSVLMLSVSKIRRHDYNFKLTNNRRFQNYTARLIRDPIFIYYLLVLLLG